MDTLELTVSFADQHELVDAARAARARGFAVVDAFTPFPVHGLDEAAGIPRSRLPVLCFALGSAGGGAAIAFQLWASVSDWPVNIGGKSFAAAPALIPIAFEVTVLAAALGTVLAFLVRSRLHPGAPFELAAPRVTDDRFALRLRVAADDLAAARALFASGGAVTVEEAPR